MYKSEAQKSLNTVRVCVSVARCCEIFDMATMGVCYIGLVESPAAENGEVAVNMVTATVNDAQKEPYDLILMDIMMPIMDGYEAMRAIRKIREYRETPILSLTAKAMPGDRLKCIEAGASDCITKPIDIDRLFSMLRVWPYKGRKNVA